MSNILELNIILNLKGAPQVYLKYNYKNNTNLKSQSTTIYIPENYSLFLNGSINPALLRYVSQITKNLSKAQAVQNVQNLFLDKDKLKQFIISNKHELVLLNTDNTIRENELKQNVEVVIRAFLATDINFFINSKVFNIESAPHLTSCKYLLPNNEEIEKNALNEKHKEIINTNLKLVENYKHDPEFYAVLKQNVVATSLEEYKIFLKNAKQKQDYIDDYIKNFKKRVFLNVKYL